MRFALPTLLLLLAGAAPAAAEIRTLAEVRTPALGEQRTAFPVVDAYGGRVVWSGYDAAAGAWRLMEHARGTTRAVPVPPRATPFDVDLGPGRDGGTVAVYSRCRRAFPVHQPAPPADSRRYGCDLYRFSFGNGRERRIESASSGADETWPAVWGSRIAFVRTYPGRPGRRGRTPYLYWSGGVRSHRLRRPSPVVVVRTSGPGGTTITRERHPFLIAGLDMRGRRVAYAWQRLSDFDTVSFVYVATTGGGLGAVARGATFGGGAADRSRSVSAPALGAGGAVDWLFENRGSRYFGSFLHADGRATRSPRSKAAAFAHAGRTAYWIDGGPGAQYDPESQPAGTFALRADDAVSYRSVPRGWLPIPPPRRR